MARFAEKVDPSRYDAVSVPAVLLFGNVIQLEDYQLSYEELLLLLYNAKTQYAVATGSCEEIVVNGQEYEIGYGPTRDVLTDLRDGVRTLELSEYGFLWLLFHAHLHRIRHETALETEPDLGTLSRQLDNLVNCCLAPSDFEGAKFGQQVMGTLLAEGAKGEGYLLAQLCEWTEPLLAFHRKTEIENIIQVHFLTRVKLGFVFGKQKGGYSPNGMLFIR